MQHSASLVLRCDRLAGYRRSRARASARSACRSQPSQFHDQQQTFDCGLPLIELLVGLRKLGDVSASVFEGDECAAIGQHNRIEELLIPRHKLSPLRAVDFRDSAARAEANRDGPLFAKSAISSLPSRMRPTMQKQRFHFRIVTASIRRTIGCEVYDRFCEGFRT